MVLVERSPLVVNEGRSNGTRKQDPVQRVRTMFTARKRSCGKVMFLHLFVIFSQRGIGVSIQRGSLSGGGGFSIHGAVSVRETPPCTVKSGRYTSYWNAFLFIHGFTSCKRDQV